MKWVSSKCYLSGGRGSNGYYYVQVGVWNQNNFFQGKGESLKKIASHPPPRTISGKDLSAHHKIVHSTIFSDEPKIQCTGWMGQATFSWPLLYSKMVWPYDCQTRVSHGATKWIAYMLHVDIPCCHLPALLGSHYTALLPRQPRCHLWREVWTPETTNMIFSCTAISRLR